MTWLAEKITKQQYDKLSKMFGCRNIEFDSTITSTDDVFPKYVKVRVLSSLVDKRSKQLCNECFVSWELCL